MSRKTVVASLAIVALGIGGVCYAQRGGGRGERGFGGGYAHIRRADQNLFRVPELQGGRTVVSPSITAE